LGLEVHMDLRGVQRPDGAGRIWIKMSPVSGKLKDMEGRTGS
jgi:hypothetical protein